MTRHTYTLVIDDDNDDDSQYNKEYIQQLIDDDAAIEVVSIDHVSTEMKEESDED